MKEPKIRFKGFQGGWVSSKYKEVFSLIGDTGHNVQKNEYCERGLYPVVDQSKEYIVGYTDKVMPIDGSKGLIIFGDHTREIKYIDFPFCTGADGTRILKSEQSFDVRFMYYVCLSLDIPNTGYNRHFKYIKESIYNIPKTKAEQQSIASYFQHLDTLIQSTTKKIESLKQVKAASLQSMFPQEGETTPRVRFKGFEGKWNTPSISEVFEIRNGYTPSKAVDAFWEGGTIPWFRMEDIREKGGILHDAIQHITPLGIKGNGLFEKNSIILSTTATIGIHAMLIADSLANQQFTNFSIRKSLKHTFDPMFVYYSFFCIDEWSKKNTNSGGLLSVNIPLLLKQPFLTPSINEQQKIASYFTNLDRQITLHTQRLEKLKQIKSACLDNMFV